MNKEVDPQLLANLDYSSQKDLVEYYNVTGDKESLINMGLHYNLFPAYAHLYDVEGEQGLAQYIAVNYTEEFPDGDMMFNPEALSDQTVPLWIPKESFKASENKEEEKKTKKTKKSKKGRPRKVRKTKAAEPKTGSAKEEKVPVSTQHDTVEVITRLQGLEEAQSDMHGDIQAIGSDLSDVVWAMKTLLEGLPVAKGKKTKTLSELRKAIEGKS